MNAALISVGVVAYFPAAVLLWHRIVAPRLRVDGEDEGE